MSTYALTHGAWHGAWCWRDVARRLRAAGHDVVTPTLTGLGDRVHLLSPTVGLDTHVRDLVATITTEQLDHVILVGHSYGGMVVPAAAAQLGPTVAHVVIIDGFLPEVGDTALGLLPESVATRYQELAAERGFGWLIPPRPLHQLGVTDAAMIESCTPRLVPQPLKTYRDASTVALGTLTTAGTFLLCAGWDTPFRPYAERAASIGWDVRELVADHEVLLTDPALLTDHLLSLDLSPS